MHPKAPVLAAISSLVVLVCGVGWSDASQPALAAGGPGVASLARQFAPVVWIHSKEDSGPASPREFLGDSALYWHRGGLFDKDKRVAGPGAVVAARLGDGCTGLEAGCYREDGARASDFTRPRDESRMRPRGVSSNDGFYLDPPDSARGGEVGVEPHAPIYYEAHRGGEIRITYWFFYGYSRPNKPFLGLNVAGRLSHEGDWENIDVAFDAAGNPKAVYFYGHGHPRPKPWRQVCKLVGEVEDCDTSLPGRPVVYSALFSHASYSTPDEERDAESRVCKKVIVQICSYDLRDRGFLWDPLAEPGDLRNARDEPWYGFGGAWGAVGHFKDTTGPLGPSRYKLSDDLEPGEQVSAAP